MIYTKSNTKKSISNDAKYWSSAVDPTTKETYYYHKLSRETSWVKPVEMKEYEEGQVPLDEIEI